MLVRRSLLLGFSMALAVFSLALSRDSWAQDVRHLCSEKYQAAKAAGTLNGETWPQFYSRCTADAKANPPAAAAPAAAAPLHTGAPGDRQGVIRAQAQTVVEAVNFLGEFVKCTPPRDVWDIKPPNEQLSGFTEKKTVFWGPQKSGLLLRTLRTCSEMCSITSGLIPAMFTSPKLCLRT